LFFYIRVACCPFIMFRQMYPNENPLLTKRVNLQRQQYDIVQSLNMKRTLVIFGVIILLVPGALGMVSGESETARILISADNPELESDLKQMVDVRYDFGRLGFTAEVDITIVPHLDVMEGVTVEEVRKYEISKPPGGCDPWPECKGGGGNGGGSREYAPDDQTPWGIEKMYDDPGIASTSGGAGVDVAVLDTGVKKDHLDLTRRVEQCKDFTGKSVKGSCKDNNGHGTHVAGTILADGGADGEGIFGMAPEADLFAYKVCGGRYCWSDDIAAAIEYAADNGAEIISISIGSDGEDPLVRDAIDYATGLGCLVVAAAGNDGSSEGSIDFPGGNAKVVAVGAIDSNENVPWWSSRGINDGDYVIERREVEFAAPGVNVESTWKNGGYHYEDGTSMATPHISGLAAKLWQGSGSSTRTHLQGLSRDIWTSGDDSATGFGLPTVP
jgi:subtilisin